MAVFVLLVSYFWICLGFLILFFSSPFFLNGLGLNLHSLKSGH